MSERTLLVIKPDAIYQEKAASILHDLVNEGFKIVAMKMVTLSREEWERFYVPIKEKWYFNRNVDFMDCGIPVVAVVLQRENAIEYCRMIVGATDPEEASPNTIRAKYGSVLPKNAVHASDSARSFVREVVFFFEEDEVFFDI